MKSALLKQPKISAGSCVRKSIVLVVRQLPTSPVTLPRREYCWLLLPIPAALHVYSCMWRAATSPNSLSQHSPWFFSSPSAVSVNTSVELALHTDSCRSVPATEPAGASIQNARSEERRVGK